MDRVLVDRSLKRILASEEFQRSDRCSSFLRYIVDQYLNGKANRLSGVCIAQDVFGRDENFDPNIDPIVRVQAGRLRKMLDAYYAGPGARDDVVISVPRGAYVPEIVLGAPAATHFNTKRNSGARGGNPLRRRLLRWAPAGIAAASAITAALFANVAALRGAPEPAMAHQSIGPHVHIAKMTVLSDDPVLASLADGLKFALLDGLSRFKNLVICDNEMIGIAGKAHLDGSGLFDSEFKLSGMVERSGDKVTVTSQLVDVRSSIVVWSHKYDFAVSDTHAFALAKTELTRDVSSALGQPYGVIDSYLQRKLAEAESVAMGDYVCLLTFYSYARQKSEKKHEAARNCLEATLEASPDWVSGWAMLSWVYGDELRFGFNPDAASAAGRSLRAARRAAALDPYDAMALTYLSNAYLISGEYEQAALYAEQAIDLNPNDSAAMVSAGNVLITVENAPRGRMLSEKAIDMNPGHPNWFHHGLAIYYYRNGDSQKALLHARAYAADGSLISALINAAALARYGETDEALSNWGAFQAAFPDAAGDPATILRAWQWQDAAIDMVAADFASLKGRTPQG